MRTRCWRWAARRRSRPWPTAPAPCRPATWWSDRATAGDGGQAARRRPGRHRHAGRPVGAGGVGRRLGADAALIAADLLAQAEHDADAVPVLVTTDAALADRVEAEVERQLGALPEPNRATAAAACGNGGIVVAVDLDAAISACNRLAPEHLEVMVAEPWALAPRLAHHGALFVGAGAAEVLGDYGAGPNHVLPTGGTARHTGGLSVLTFLRVRTWLEITDRQAGANLAEDATRLARLEGLEAHARAAERRR
ncbi:MAG: histidinol dehydrogenase [Myxococcota bacterium]